MTDEAECIHGLGLVSACTICNGRDRRGALPDPTRRFQAKYEGHCAGCNLPIAVGDWIAWAYGKPVTHVDCA